MGRARVPKVLGVCDDTEVIGAPFYVMERVRGVVLRTPLPPGVDLEPGLMRDLCLALIDTLVELHGLDYVARPYCHQQRHKGDHGFGGGVQNRKAQGRGQHIHNARHALRALWHREGLCHWMRSARNSQTGVNSSDKNGS